ncbi:hypothetical protein ACI2K4_13720 [Micromonospora sp. NPDC050397]|uniref:hypothetical protein n=1 Tax=Micromonospora sp. NPDC050397 TaxID=3364279 RepID=UPI00384FC122
MAKNRTTSAERLSIGGGILALIGLFWIADEPRGALFAVLSLLIPYFAFMLPLRCREETNRGTACKKSRWGWLIGCNDHRWQRLQRVFSVASGGRVASEAPILRGARQRPATHSRRAPVPATTASGGIPSPSGARSWFDRLSLLLAAISCVAGVAQVLLPK